MKNKIEIPEGNRKCPFCDGKGEGLFSCCSGDRISEDYGRCPDCKEGLGLEICLECKGTGFVRLEDYIEAPVLIDPIGQIEAAYEGER